MEALDALLKEVESLDREATPGPWRFVKHGGAVPGSEDDHPVVEFCEWRRKGRKRVPAGDFGGIHIDEFRSVEGDDDATGALVAHYRTAAPRLAAIVRVLLGNATSLVDLVAPRHARRPNGEFQINCGSCGARVDYADEDARDVASARMVHDDVCPYFKTVTALARIEALAKGEA